jgi:hypothetical protein
MTEHCFAIISDDPQVIRELLCGPIQHDEHMRGYRWEIYVRDQRNSMAERDAMLMAAVRAMAAERRARLAAAQLEIAQLEAAD